MTTTRTVTPTTLTRRVDGILPGDSKTVVAQSYQSQRANPVGWRWYEDLSVRGWGKERVLSGRKEGVWGVCSDQMFSSTSLLPNQKIAISASNGLSSSTYIRKLISSRILRNNGAFR